MTTLNLLERLEQGPVICAEGYLFEMERRGYLLFPSCRQPSSGPRVRRTMRALSMQRSEQRIVDGLRNGGHVGRAAVFCQGAECRAD